MLNPAAKSTRRWAGSTVRSSGARGFTLIELVMVIVLLGIIAAVGSQMLAGTFSSYFTARDVSVRDGNARLALERMTRELRAARSASAADLSISPSSRISFYDTDGNAVCFYLNGTTLTRSSDFACSSGAQPLADGITALQFTYLRSDGVTAESSDPTQVRYITVALTAAQNGISTQLRATVSPRNFP